jgi:DNA-binding transcriptional ArsR family regulator
VARNTITVPTLNRMIALRKKGKSISEIAEELDLPKSTIYYHIRTVDPPWQGWSRGGAGQHESNRKEFKLDSVGLRGAKILGDERVSSMLNLTWDRPKHNG